MMDVSRHKSMDTLRGYVRNAELFRDHRQTALRVTHWKPIDSFDANRSCVYDSAPHGISQPRTLIIPPTMVDPDPDIPAGVVS
jgi:hypothetical protein